MLAFVIAKVKGIEAEGTVLSEAFQAIMKLSR
jgi:hypothetical protein